MVAVTAGRGFPVEEMRANSRRRARPLLEARKARQTNGRRASGADALWALGGSGDGSEVGVGEGEVSSQV